MKPEQQVCSLDLAERLKELGVKQESLFYWCNQEQGADYDTKEVEWHLNYGQQGWVKKVLISAFTVAELGEMLPALYYSMQHAGLKQWVCNLFIGARLARIEYPNGKATTEADARAKMLIYLLEYNFIKP